MLDESADRDLALWARGGNAQAFGVLVQRYQSAVYSVCYRLMGERREAEDMAQEAFVRAYRRMHLYDERLPFGPWMRKVAANVCLNALQRKSPTLFSLDRDDEQDYLGPRLSAELGHDPAWQYDQAATVESVRRAILTLPPHYRLVVELCHFQELSYAEAAESLGLPLSDVKSHLFRARRQLANRLADLKG